METKDTGQYYDTHDMIMVKDVRGEVIMMSIDLDTTASRLDSRTASEVSGVQLIVIYMRDKEAKVVYIRKNSWDQCKFEDTDHRMVTTTTLIVRSDYISVDHTGKMFYKFKDKIVENYKLTHCKLNYIAMDHRKILSSQISGSTTSSRTS